VKILFPLLLGLFLSAFGTKGAAPLINAHAHNDYEHKRPLFDALDHGFCGVEADIHLVDGKLLVAHDAKDLSPAKTLESLYLDPLRARINANGGRVYRDGPSVMLLIDIKTEALATYNALTAVLEKYADILTRFEANKIETNAIIAIVSGNRSLTAMQSQKVRFAAYDGRLPDLESSAPSALIPLISDNWTLKFKWRGQGELSLPEKGLLDELVAKAHAQGRRIRFWAVPDSPIGWEILHKAGVDLLNTDHLAELEKFLRSR
jgi:glycerophosphoryl diester phosphodiesterase